MKLTILTLLAVSVFAQPIQLSGSAYVPATLPFSTAAGHSTLSSATFVKESRTETATYEMPGSFFLIEFKISPYAMTTMPAVAGASPHTGATISVYEIDRGRKLIATFSGEYTGGKCFEDRPLELIRRALKASVGSDSEKSALCAPDRRPCNLTRTSEEVKDAIRHHAQLELLDKQEAIEAYAKSPLYTESDGILSISPRGSKELNQIVVDGKVVWRR